MLKLIKYLSVVFLIIPAISLAANNNKALITENSSFDTGKMAPDYRTYLGDIKFNNPTGVWNLVTSPLPTPPPDTQAAYFYHIAYKKGRPVHQYDMPRYYYESITPKERAQLLKKPSGF